MNRKVLAILGAVILTVSAASCEQMGSSETKQLISEEQHNNGYGSSYNTGYSLGYYMGYNACQYNEPYNDDIMSYPFFFELQDDSGKRLQAYMEGVNDGLNEGFNQGYHNGWDDCNTGYPYDPGSR